MFTNLSKIPIKLGILLVGFGLLVAGCDSAGTNNQNNDQDKVEEKIAFEAVDANLADRITNFDGSSSNSAKTAAQKSAPGFTIKAHVPTPNVASGPEAASHLALSQNPGGGNPPRLYVGYKIADDQDPNTGPNYGGGIDIINAPSGSFSAATGTDANTLQSPAVDVQELALGSSSGNPAVLYAATAVDPNVTVPRAPQLHSINLDQSSGLPATDVTFDLVELLNSEDEGDPPAGDVTKVAKSVVFSGSYSNNTATAYAVSDEGTAHSIPTPNGYEINEDNMNTLESGSREYRSVARVSTGGSSGTYALGLNGDIFKVNFGGGSSVTNITLSDVSNTEGTAGDGIARLTEHDFGNGTRLLASLNENGLRVINPNGGGSGAGDKVYSGSEYATSAAATDNFVYVASNNGIAVYEVKNGDGNLEYLGTQPLHQLGNGSSASKKVQVNDIVVDPRGSNNNILYVAKSTDGVYKIEQDAASAWNP